MLSFTLALRNIFRHGFRSVAVLIVLSLSALVIILIGGFYSSLFSFVEQAQVASEGHIRLTAADQDEEQNVRISHYPELAALLADNPEIRIVSPRMNINGLAGYGERTVLFSGEGVDLLREEEMRRWSESQHGAVETEPAGAFLGQTLAGNLMIREGDFINFLVGWSGFSLPVAGLVETASSELDRFYVRLPLETVAGAVGTDDVDSVHLIVRDPELLSDTAQNLEMQLSAAGFELRVETFDQTGSYFQQVKDIYMNNYRFVLVVIVMAAFFAVFNTLTMSLMERYREIGTLRSIGFSKKRVLGMVLTEGFVLGFVGFLIGGMASIAAISLINLSGGIYIPPPPTTDTGMYVGCTPPVAAYLTACGVLVSVCAVSSLISSLKIHSLTIMEELGHS